LILPDFIWNLKNEEVKTGISAESQLFDEDDDSQPLPKPEWGSEPEHLEFSSLVTFQFFLQELKMILAAELESHPYNTFGSFIDFYDAFLKQSQPFEDFYQSYEPTILQESLSCVGLGCSLIDSMKASLCNCYPGLKCALFIASCEEVVLDVDTYTTFSPPASSTSVKEHVLVVLRVKVEGREGYIVLDPGYHVNIPVIVMSDGKYPNTGWFLLSETSKVKKEYNYAVDSNYIKWYVKETRGGKVKSWTNLIYSEKKFLSYISVSEKRNLVFNFRTLVARDERQPVAGFYCNFEGDEKFTFFFNDESYNRQEVKIPFDYFQTGIVNNQFDNAISSCVSQIGYNKTLILDMINRTIEAYFNPDFMPFVRLLNKEIDEE